MLRVLRWEENLGNLAGVRNFTRRLARPLLLVGMMFLLMRAEILFGCAPLAAALMAAGLAAGESPAALVAGCLLGMFRLPLTSISVLPAISCAAVLGGEILFSAIPRLKNAAPESRVCGIAGFAVLIPALVKAGGYMNESAMAAACAAIAAAAAPFFLPALQIRAKRRKLMLQERVGALLLAAACLCGVQNLFPPLASGFANLMLLLSPGAGMGVLAGLALAAGGAGLARLAPLSLCGLVCGCRLFAERWQRALALCLSSAAWQLAARGSPDEILYAALAGIIFLIFPADFLRRAQLIAAPEVVNPCDPDRVAREVTAESQRRLRSLGDAFADMAESCTAPTDVPGEQELICEMRSRLCTDCPGYSACWTGDENRAVRFLCQLITEALDRVDAPPGMRVLFSDGEIPPDVLRVCRRGRLIPDRLGLLLRDFAEKRRAEIKRCATGQLLSVQLTQAREILYDLAEKQAAPVSFHGPRLEQLNAALDSAGLTGCEAAALGFENAEIRLTRPGEWTRDEVQRASAALAKAFGGGFTPELRGDALLFAQHPRLMVDTGVSCQSGVAGEVSGDSHLTKMLGRNKLVLMLSDGMGSGEAAAGESMETLRLLWKFLCAGISRPLALETVNQQMLMRSGEDMYATVDLCVIDLNTGLAEFSKLAACRTLILRGGEVLRIEGGRLPLGILERVQPAVSRVKLRPGDVIVMGSDGVMEVGDGMMIERIARLNSACEPEQLASELVREAGIRRSRSRTDDLTCICARIQLAATEKRRRSG
ncbi:MAG: SpoIIE family protein phosphatase [Clostridia bacterium]|nr:SpoIIE family protein phosphatase [Clostridia bacterium]